MPPKSVKGEYLGYEFPNLKAHRVLIPSVTGKPKSWQTRHILCDESALPASTQAELDLSSQPRIPSVPAMLIPVPPSVSAPGTPAPITTPEFAGATPADVTRCSVNSS